MPNQTSVFLVFEDEPTRVSLRNLFSNLQWQVQESASVAEFSRSLEQHWRGVVMTNDAFTDGTWRDILALATAVCPDAQTVVASPQADEYLWAEVLNRGGFDLIEHPLDALEVRRAANSAWSHASRKALRPER